jgi:hypothetical protein
MVPGATKEQFYRTLDGAPYAARAFFENIEARFSGRNTAFVHHTRTNGGDMRVAIPKELTTTGKHRNFATMCWQATTTEVFSRLFLTPEELKNLGFPGASIPKYPDEPLKSDLYLSEPYWRYKSEEFGRLLEASHIKMLAHYQQ